MSIKINLGGMDEIRAEIDAKMTAAIKAEYAKNEKKLRMMIGYTDSRVIGVVERVLSDGTVLVQLGGRPAPSVDLWDVEPRP